MIPRDQLISILDVVISEYGWSVEYCLKLPHDILLDLYKQINHRKHDERYLQTKLMMCAVNAGFAGKPEIIDSVFKKSKVQEDEVVDADTWKAQLKALWIRMKRDPKVFEEKWAKGEQINL